MDNSKTDGKVIYEQDGIFIFIYEANGDRILEGKIFVVQMPYGILVEWKQTEETEYSLEQVHEWSMVNATVGYRVDKNNDALELKAYKGGKREISFELTELKCFKYLHPEQGWPQIMFYLRDGTIHSPMYFQIGNIDHLIDTLKKFTTITESKEESNLWYVSDPEMDALERSLNEVTLFRDSRKHFVSKFLQDPYTTTLSGFSKVTKVLIDYMVSDGSQNSRSNRDVSAMLQGAFDLDVNQYKEPGFELITKHNLIERPKVQRKAPLDEVQWLQHIDSEGRIISEEKLLQTIFQGGIVHSIRRDVWKFLLGYYKFDSTYKERQELRKKSIDDYYRMKLQWKTISEDQEQRFSDFKEKKNSIEKDAKRTDRSLPFFQGENNENVQILFDILMTYCMYNFDLGYVQGMNDLLSPILILMENEVDAFWCFVGFMDRLESNFVMDLQGIKTQLQNLHVLLKFLDPELCEFFEKHKSQHLLFCFQWLLLWFKREFQFNDVMQLWEVLWTGLPCKNFHLLFALAILDTEKRNMIETKNDGADILKHINEISEHIQLEENLKKAEGMYLQLANCNFLPSNIQDILGIVTNHELSEEIPSSSSQFSEAVELGATANKSPQSNNSSIETSSIEILPEYETEQKFQQSLDLQFL